MTLDIVISQLFNICKLNNIDCEEVKKTLYQLIYYKIIGKLNKNSSTDQRQEFVNTIANIDKQNPEAVTQALFKLGFNQNTIESYTVSATTESIKEIIGAISDQLPARDKTELLNNLTSLPPTIGI